jgi:predicted nucleic acid-binding protein
VRVDPIPLGAEAPRLYGRICAAVISAGRKPRRRIADLMIASIAVAEGLPLFTTNPDDFKGLADLLIASIALAEDLPHER